MGLESLVFTFIRLAKAERVDQWVFDETSLDGVSTLNQWCRIVEDNETVVLTIECAGLTWKHVISGDEAREGNVATRGGGRGAGAGGIRRACGRVCVISKWWSALVET